MDLEELDVPRIAEIEEEPMGSVEVELSIELLPVPAVVGSFDVAVDILIPASVTDAPTSVADIDAIVFEIVGRVSCISDCDVGPESEGRPPVD